MPTTLRFVRLLAIAVWVGGLVFFAFVLAPAAFHILPTIHLAGLVVGGTLRTFHDIAEVAGSMFIAATVALAMLVPTHGRRRLAAQLALAAAMLLTTLYLQASLLPAMETDRAIAGGDIDAAAKNDPARIHFDHLHALSEHLEGAVLFAGLGILLLMASEPVPRDL